MKTTGPGKVLSFSTFEDKGKLVKSHFDCNVSDRIAPVILSAFSKEENNCSNITIKVSEPVQIDENYTQEAFSYYLNSAKEPSQKFVSLKQKSPVLISDDNEISLSICRGEKPSNGDFIRFRADSWLWSDLTNINSEYHWNAPTNYNETKRLPSPWVPIIDRGSKNQILYLLILKHLMKHIPIPLWICKAEFCVMEQFPPKKQPFHHLSLAPT